MRKKIGYNFLKIKLMLCNYINMKELILLFIFGW